MRTAGAGLSESLIEKLKQQSYIKVPRTFRAARSRWTIPRSSKYDIPYSNKMHHTITACLQLLIWSTIPFYASICTLHITFSISITAHQWF